MNEKLPEFSVKDLAFVRRSLRMAGIKANADFHNQCVAVCREELRDADDTIWIRAFDYCMRKVYSESMAMAIIIVDDHEGTDHRFAKLESAVHCLIISMAGASPANAKP